LVSELLDGISPYTALRGDIILEAQTRAEQSRYDEPTLHSDGCAFSPANRPVTLV
jgi:hypothetical protein